MLSGDTNPIRDIGHVRWRDVYAKLENQSGPEFKAAVKRETEHWRAAGHRGAPRAKEWARQFADVYKDGIPQTPEYAHESYVWQDVHIYVQHGHSHTKNVWVGETAYIGIKNFGTDAASKHFFVIRDVGSGGEDLELSMYVLDSPPRRLYTLEHVGEYACFMAAAIVYQTTENRLRTPGVVYADAATGGERYANKLYHEYDPRFQVEIAQHAYDDTVHVKCYNALTQQLGRIVGSTDPAAVAVEWITPRIENSGSLFAINSKMYAGNNGIYILEKSNNVSYHPLPHNVFVMDAFAYKGRVYVATIHACVMNIYVFHPKTFTYEKLTHAAAPCTIRFHTCPGTPPRFALHTPHQPTQLFQLNTSGGNVHPLLQTFPSLVDLPYFEHGSARAGDGATVPYWYVSHVEHPHAVIVSAYGAYGITAYAGYPLRWLPYLREGYALVVAAPRGGRDKGDDWYNGGRTAARKRTTFDDTAAVITAAQARFHFKPARTIMYGRSAGGWLAAYVGLKYAARVAAVYAEVPYLDVLRTTTNPALPLTQLEYDEFGDPVHRPEEFKALRAISPTNIVRRAPADGGPYFLLRTALHDAQVLPYEVLKFAKHLRKNGWGVAVGLDMDGGHFTKPTSSAEIQGEDAALLERVLGRPAPPAADTGTGVAATAAASRRRRTRNARTHASKGATRRRRIIS